ncbi:RNA polymerase sigma factor SigJ [Promicromonospora thailandica]|uniref:RNA polymerase sigma-70 factor, ECF subfamily n=1 Tax=Promicromonospora thailandica TaxID=765201 RepID=A0A9X2G7P7_9MICO|nr:RNA polymerase sigma factor SigJ [Promicromonospora thailandica]MCP2266877.1 RNA polymerase sigma-70 factor, ECF subfamily [Promicromonospora thailandica]BFF16542.1 RNA polymerase sigma factor SigJ [Promicromonospora thailandica]
MTDDLEDVFAERRRLLSLAYRMTGTLADAEDIVQETYLRWYRLGEAARAEIANPAGWLTRVASRIALDLLDSARRRREQYIGQWLPEPVPAGLFDGTAPGSGLAGSSTANSVDPLDRVTLDDAVSTALLVVLESMTPAERVAFVLHDVFAIPFDEIARIVRRSPAAVRQLATSGRRHVRENRTAVVPRAEHDRVVRAFLHAAQAGDVDRLVRVLAPDVQLWSDGGGVVTAALNVIEGPDRVARFVLGVDAKMPALTHEVEPTGGGLGVLLRTGDLVSGVMSFRVRNGLVTDIWVMLNPAKLTGWLPEPGTNRGGYDA